jgi:hypothetical protein
MTPSEQHWSTEGSTALVCVATWLAFSVAMYALGPYSEISRLANGALLEERFGGYDAHALSAALEKLTSSGRALYEQFQVLDSANAILMATALTLALRYLVTRLFGSAFGVVAILPVFAGGLELVENALLLDALWAFPAEGRLAAQTGAVTQVKLGLGFATLALVAISAAALLTKGIARRVAGA